MKTIKAASRNRLSDRFYKLLTVATLLLGVVIFWLVSGRSAERTDRRQANSGLPLTTIQPPATCRHCAENLVGADENEIGQFALDIANRSLHPRGNTAIAQVRPIKWDEAPGLGIGCLPDFASIEDAPLALVVLKGDMDFGDINRGTQYLPEEERRVNFVVMVLDLWAGAPVYTTASKTGAELSKLLNDPALPKAPVTAPMTCPPRAPRTVHYGEAAGGRIFPTFTPSLVDSASPTTALPPVIPTPGSRLPAAVPTSQVQP